MPTTNKQITVLVAETQDTLSDRGGEFEYEFDTIAEAKRRAKYYLTDDYRIACESSMRLGYSQVRVNGECLYDYFAK